jgi:hypothetical protein
MSFSGYLLVAVNHSVIPFLKFCVGQKVYVGLSHDAAQSCSSRKQWLDLFENRQQLAVNSSTFHPWTHH